MLFRSDETKWTEDNWNVNYREDAKINCYPTGTSPCKTACPAHLPVQGYVKMAAEGRFREALREKYIAPLIPRLVGILLLSVLGYGALIGLTWLLMDFSVQPLYVFTEWVPENIVSWSSLTKVFWNLTGSAAGLARMGTRELRVIEFWGGLARWGSALVLTGAALRGFRKDYH